MRSANLTGAGWILVSGIGTTAMSVGVRALGADLPSPQIAFSRCAVGLALVLPILLSTGITSITTSRWRLHLVRGLLAVIGINCGFYALTHMPLVTVTALFFTTPLFVTILAVLMLRERVGWPRWLATSVGFVGTLVVLGFNPGGFNPLQLVPLGASVTFAASLVVSKRLSTTERPITILFYFGVITTIGCLPPALMVWVPPTPQEVVLLIAVGCFATSRAYCDIRGYAMAQASFVAPFFYFRILFMGLAGYLLFSEIPDANALVGALIIVLSTFYITQSELRGRHQTGRAISGGPNAT